MIATATKEKVSYKILVIGDPGTGKTSIIRRFVHNVFTANYKATIGVDFALKVLALDENSVVHLQIWDISGIGCLVRQLQKINQSMGEWIETSKKSSPFSLGADKDDFQNLIL
ncbi:unnamed protein product [Caenorhabditis auriculariae]|uniref:Ras family protein n=1 Tax=Caenorhabditis auriculariae TaxID=2777116 RepID=A0A8S1GVE6_9PELO|nr:unnamed protein product [Caenorhabditis auriculariae]